MTAELDWVLSRLGSVVESTTVPLRRVDRDSSRILEQGLRSIKGELQEANYVGATHVETVRDPIGTEYDADREVVIGVRVTGLHHSEWGYIDPDGDEGIPFPELVQRLQDALWAERTFPPAGPPGVEYTHLEITNEANTSNQYADFHQYSFDVLLSGYEQL
jgi:hypothetical protein